MDVDGISIAKALEIEEASIVSGVVNGSGHLVLTNGGGTEFNAGLVIKPAKVELLYDTGVTLGWLREPGAVMFHIQAIGGGGGGAAGTVSGGDNASGGGGSGGGWDEIWIPASAFATLDDDFWRIDIGAGGVGGGFSGAAGSPGEYTEFWYNDGGNHRSILQAPGGLGGLAVSPVSTGQQPVAAAPSIFAGPGGSGRGDYATPNSVAAALRGGGGGGGGINAGSAAIQNGGIGGAGAGASPQVGSSGQLPFYAGTVGGIPMGGGGGMGGGSHTSAPIARPGYNGGIFGGGGGGGAGVSLQFGNGGNGASGMLLITTYF